MVVRNIAIFSGGAILGAVAVGSYLKSKEGSKPVLTPKFLVPAVPPPPGPVGTRPLPPGSSVGNVRKIMPHGFPGWLYRRLLFVISAHSMRRSNGLLILQM